MNKLSLQKRAQIIGLLVEGNSMRSVTRLVGCSIKTALAMQRPLSQSNVENRTAVRRSIFPVLGMLNAVRYLLARK